MTSLLAALLFVVLVVLVALAWMWSKLPRGVRKALIEFGFPGLARVLRFGTRSVAQCGVLLVSTMKGRVAAFALASAMLWDASWGSDMVGIPVVGTFGASLAALVVGGVMVRRWDKWCGQVEEVLRENVPRYRQTEERRSRTRYGVGGPLRLHAGDYDFRFSVPAAVQPVDLVELETRFRNRLPAVEGTSFGFDWQLKRGLCHAVAVKDIPTSITLSAAMSDAQASAAGYAPNWTRPLSSDPLRIPLGVALSREGRLEIAWDPKNFYGSLLVAGAPGGGKSCLLRMIAAHMLMHPEDWVLYAVDMKRVEIGYMRRYSPVVREVAVELEPAAGVFSNARAEMKRRYSAIEKAGVQNIHELNGLREGRGQARVPHVAVMCDEVAELILEGKGKSEETKAENDLKAGIRADMVSISQLGRASGVHLVLSTQRPTVDVVDGLIKSNVQARVAMGGLDRTGSDVAIESPMAAELPGISGRGVWYESGRLKQFQAYYASTGDLDRIHAAHAGAKGRAA